MRCILCRDKTKSFEYEVLKNLGLEVIREYEVSVFFCLETYKALVDSKTLGIPLFGIFYEENKGVGGGGIIQRFLAKALEIKENLYYYPKPNIYLQVDSVALFALFNGHTPERLLIEIFYKEQLLPMQYRNSLHKHLAQALNFSSKRITLEGRPLSNLSKDWKLFEDKTANTLDITYRVKEFYPAPVHINLGTINKCNLKCSFCFFFAPEYVKTHTTDFFKEYRILDEKIVYAIMDYSAKYDSIIDLVGPCEMLVDKRIPDFIRYGKDVGVRWISMTTNGLLLDEEMADRLLESSLDSLSISIDAATPETYAKSRGGNFEKLVKNIESFLTKIENRNINIYITLSIILQGGAEKEVEMFKEKWSAYKAVNEIYVRNLVEKNNEGMEVSHDRNFDTSCRYTCQKPWDEIHINPDGGVMPCCTMAGAIGWENKVMGNLYEESMDSIWINLITQKMRLDLIKGDFGEWKICKDCEEWSYRSVEQENGDVISPCIEFVKIN